ncbi:DUF2309 domain-containing protein [Citromicrobium bathyomarinum]
MLMSCQDPVNEAVVSRAAEAAARQIPPLWPLSSSVAVNPFLGQSEATLAQAAARLSRVGEVPVVMPRGWYAERIASGEIAQTDLAAALACSPHESKPRELSMLEVELDKDVPIPNALRTVADLVAERSGTDWPGIIAERIGVWAGGYFDRGQALWAAPRDRSAWAAWRAYATHDLTPEIMGLKGFARFVAEAPENARHAIARSVARLGLGEAALDTVFHQLLMSLGGWAQFARYELWRAELAGTTDDTLIDLLAIRLLWEEALFLQHETQIDGDWTTMRAAHSAPIRPSRRQVVDEILQEAAERAAQRKLAATLATPLPGRASDRPALQAAFCIDVRSEVFRRALESVDPAIRTLGFAGFFGVAAEHRRFASDVDEHRLPVLLNPAVTSRAGGVQDAEGDLAQRYRARAKRAWGRFKLAAVSSFAFVEAMGPVYIGKLVRDGLGIASASARDDPAPRFDPDLAPEARVDAVETVLRAMSLVDGFAPIVLLAGHGANVVNNPHASGLHCGACGGYSGEVNARLLAQILNDPAVREALVERGIAIPHDTLFVAALHDTTTDRVTLYDRDRPSDAHRAQLDQVRHWLAAAGEIARGERAQRLPGARRAQDVSARAHNWAEVRPVWGLTGCQAFIAAPRQRTSGRNLEGRTFLHDYDWRLDEERGFPVLELIMTAPVVVASWISLQYYGSAVAPQAFGAGNKLLHNVVGGVGVLEGNGGPLRAGLPWQSVHDGEKLIHQPLRLSVCIEAPCEAMSDILSRHDGVRSLFDKRWLHLFAMGAEGLTHRYLGGSRWEALPADKEAYDAGR